VKARQDSCHPSRPAFAGNLRMTFLFWGSMLNYRSQFRDRALRSGQAHVHVPLPGGPETAIAMATAKYRHRLRDGAQSVDIRALKDSSSTCSTVARSRNRAPCAGAVPDGSHPAERGRESAIPGQSRRLTSAPTDRVAAHQRGRRGLQRRGGLPLSSAERQAALRTARHRAATGRDRRALLGRVAAGIYDRPTSGRSTPRRDFWDPDDGDTRGIESLGDILTKCRASARS